LRGVERIRMSPATTKLSEAKNWLKRVGATLDGIVAKRRDLEYRSGDRTGMQKIKNYRSADCVIGGFRYNEGKPVVGWSKSTTTTLPASASATAPSSCAGVPTSRQSNARWTRLSRRRRIC
jgi:hypothetical protein